MIVMTMIAPGKASLIAGIEDLLPRALKASKEWQFNQAVYLIGGTKKCNVLSVLAQTQWKQLKVGLCQDGTLCLVWGWHDSVNIPKPKEPKGIVRRLKWFIHYHAFGFNLGGLWRYLSLHRLGIVAHELDEIVDPLYAGYGFPLWAHTPKSGRSTSSI